MAYIRYIPTVEAGPRLSSLYRRYADARGDLDNILRVHSLDPPSMEHHYDLYRHLVAGPSQLSRTQREMIAVTVSAENDCFYRINHHGAGLRAITGTPEPGSALARGARPAGLDPRDAVMLDYAVKLTRDPGSVTSMDAGALRTAGFDDRAILDICQLVAYYNYVNRLADGLGVELEEGWQDKDCTVTREEFEALREARRRQREEGAGA